MLKGAYLVAIAWTGLFGFGCARDASTTRDEKRQVANCTQKFGARFLARYDIMEPGSETGFPTSELGDIFIHNVCKCRVERASPTTNNEFSDPCFKKVREEFRKIATIYRKPAQQLQGPTYSLYLQRESKKLKVATGIDDAEEALRTLVNQLKVIPAGQNQVKVVEIEADSVFLQAGLRVGDLVEFKPTGNAAPGDVLLRMKAYRDQKLLNSWVVYKEIELRSPPKHGFLGL